MERKLIRQGGGGFTIYLPKKWVEENNLSKGNELSLEASGKDLIISSKPSEKKSEILMKLPNYIENSIRTIITNAYRSGYDKINIHFSNENQFKILQNIIKTRLIGFEVIKKEKNFCIVENITEPTLDQFDNLLNKMFMNIEELFEVTKKRLTNNFKEIEDFNEIEERIHKYDNFCRRVIIKQKLIKQKSEMFWTFISQIIHSQRELYFLNKIIDKNTKISKQTLELFEECNKAFNLIHEAYTKKDLDNLWKVQDIERNTIYKKAYSLMQSKNGKENIIIYHLTACLRQLNLSTSPLTGLIV